MKRTLFVFIVLAAGSMACMKTAPEPTQSPPEAPSATETAHSIVLAHTATTEPQKCVVIADALNVRDEPIAGGVTNEQVHRGDVLSVIDRGAWLRVKTKSGAVGFVNSKFCE